MSRLHNFAILIAAHNEEDNIVKLIESIKKQTYPSELITIFVVADNCTDNTAIKAYEAGAIVWERFDDKQVGKGYAIDYLLFQMDGLEFENAFDGYFIFDADNLLDENYILEMNKYFADENKIVTGYRNSKNYCRSWLSAGLSIWHIWGSQFLNRSRYRLKANCAISGTGFLFHSNFLEKFEGWKFFMPSEDVEFTIHNVINGYKIAYCESAILYDEHPEKFNQSWSQRIKSTAGYIEVFKKYGAKLISTGLSKPSFSCCDMAMTIMPAIIIVALGVAINIMMLAIGLIFGNNAVALFEFYSHYFAYTYLALFMIGTITTISEWKRIKCNAFMKVLYTFTFPIFMFTYIPIVIIALLKSRESTTSQ